MRKWAGGDRLILFADEETLLREDFFRSLAAGNTLADRGIRGRCLSKVFDGREFGRDDFAPNLGRAFLKGAEAEEALDLLRKELMTALEEAVEEMPSE